MTIPDISNALVTAFITVITGSLVFAISNLVLKFIYDLYVKLNQAKGDVIAALFMFDSVVPSTWDIETEIDKDRLSNAKTILWEKGSQLISISNSVPLYEIKIAFSLHDIPTRSELIQSGQLLLEIAETIGKAHFPDDLSHLSKCKNQIIELLDIEYVELNSIEL